MAITYECDYCGEVFDDEDTENGDNCCPMCGECAARIEEEEP